VHCIKESLPRLNGAPIRGPYLTLKFTYVLYIFTTDTHLTRELKQLERLPFCLINPLQMQLEPAEPRGAQPPGVDAGQAGLAGEGRKQWAPSVQLLHPGEGGVPLRPRPLRRPLHPPRHRGHPALGAPVPRVTELQVTLVPSVFRGLREMKLTNSMLSHLVLPWRDPGPPEHGAVAGAGRWDSRGRRGRAGAGRQLRLLLQHLRPLRPHVLVRRQAVQVDVNVEYAQVQQQA
jgi:hypothetical protein